MTIEAPQPDTAIQHTVIPILYSFRRCPYAMRARLALYYAGITLELREIVLRDKPAPMLSISPKGTVPVLHLPCGRVIDESLDIMRYALAQSDPDDWLGRADENLIQLNDTEFKYALDRYKYPGRYPEEDCSHSRGQCLAFFQSLEERLQHQKFLSANHLSLTDMAIFPFIRQGAHVDRNWFYALPLSALHRWLSDRMSSALFGAILKKYKPWQDGDAPLIWPEVV